MTSIGSGREVDPATDPVVRPSWYEALAQLAQPDYEREEAVGAGAQAAVTVLALGHTAPAFLMTARSVRLHEHGGEVSFPGGRMEALDADPRSAALRELGEEVGIDPLEVVPLGYLPPIRTQSGSRYRVIPVLAWLPDAFDFTIRQPSAEVDYTFGLPFAIALDPARYGEIRVPGSDRSAPVLRWDGPLIWGATARILRDCATRFDPGARDRLG